MSKFVGFIVGAALVVVGIVTGNPYLIVQGGAMIVSNAIMLLTMPKQPARAASEMAIQLGEQPRSAFFGEGFTAGSLVDGFNYGGKYGTDWEVLIIRLADHKCHGLTGFYVNDEFVPYTRNGNYAKFDDHHFELYFRADTSTDPLPDIVVDNWPQYDPQDVGKSGCDVIVAYLADAPDAEEPAWPGGRPRFGFVLRGKYCYDPRLDDTVTGGSGPHRWEDPTTWEFSENPVICRYNWVRGVFTEDDVTDPTKLLVGRGLTAEEAPPENVIAPANLCDEDNDDYRPYITIDDGPLSYTAPSVISEGATWYARSSNGGGTSIEFYHLPSRSLYSVENMGDVSAGTVGNIDLAADGTAYWYGLYTSGVDVLPAWWLCIPGEGTTQINIEDAWTAINCRVFDMGDNTRKVYGGADFDDGYFLNGANVPDVGLYARDFAIHDTGSHWASFEPDGPSDQIILKCIDGDSDNPSITITSPNARTDKGGCPFCHVARWNHFLVIDTATDTWMLVDDDTTATPGTIKASGSYSGETINIPRKRPAAISMWSAFTEYSLEDMTVIRTIAPNDWVVEDTGLASRIIYDPVGHGLITKPQFENHLTERFLTSEQRFRIAGPVYANQTFLDVEEMFAASCGGSVVTREGSVELEPAQAKSVVASFTDDDLLSGSQVSWNQGVLSDSSDEWVNTVVARYVEPRQKWNDHAAPVVRDTDDIILDGRPREASITLRLVRDAGQALRIAEMARRLGRLWGRASVTLGPRFCEIEDGDWIAWTSDRYFGGSTINFRVEAYGLDEKWQIRLTLREINSAAFDADTFPVDHSVGLPRPPLPRVGKPDEDNWDLTAGTLDSEGASIPVLIIEGSSDDDPAVTGIIFEYWKDDGVSDPVGSPTSVTWSSVGGTSAPDTTRVEITSVTGGATYYAAVRYVVSGGGRSRRLVLGPVTLTDYNTNPIYQLEDGVTPLLLEDDATTLRLG